VGSQNFPSPVSPPCGFPNLSLASLRDRNLRVDRGTGWKPQAGPKRVPSKENYWDCGFASPQSFAIAGGLPLLASRVGEEPCSQVFGAPVGSNRCGYVDPVPLQFLIDRNSGFHTMAVFPTAAGVVTPTPPYLLLSRQDSRPSDKVDFIKVKKICQDFFSTIIVSPW